MRALASVPSAGTDGRRPLLFGLLVLGLMFIICAPLFVDMVAQDAPRAIRGEISYHRWGPLIKPVRLGGEWRMTWLGGPASSVAAGTELTAAVPGPWDGIATPDGRHLPGIGVASYRLSIRDLPAGRYTLYIPTNFAADRVLIDGQLIEQRGTIGSSAATTRYDLRSHEISFEKTDGQLALRIDLANFLHRDEGFGDAPVFGLADPMRRWIALEWAKDLLFQGALLLLTLTALVAYLFRRQDLASLFLALATLALQPSAAVLGYDDLLLIAFPNLTFPAILAVIYGSAIFALAFFLAYARWLFRRETPFLLFWALEALIGLFLLSQIFAFTFADTITASRIAVIWPAILGLTLVSILGIVLRAALRSRNGAAVFLVGLTLFALLMVNTALAWSGLVPRTYLLATTTRPLGMLMLLFSNFVVIAERWSVALGVAERTSDDLRELLEVNSAIASEMQLDVLLARIVELTSHMLGADRGSLLLHDERTGELWSLVAEGLEVQEIRISSDVGLAGHAFTHGEILNVPNAYLDERFNRGVDAQTDYRTMGILSIPVIARDGRRLGVMQALNRRDGRPFNAHDEKRMQAFAAQAAIAIDNAKLFAEVVEQRNYNESILRSMSSGVITLGVELEIAKLNAAATVILGVPPGLLEGANARQVLAATNPWLIEEIDTVTTTGEMKLLIDVDLLVAGGRTTSTNITIVPLLGETGPVGLLLLIEDISEGKRLQGAMRRFMTQKVVDQVLERRDELLFGTACTASVLFADIRNFTSMAEALTPRETVDMLNEAFTEFFEAVAACDGVLDKFIGDAIMAVYGAPLTTGRDPENAVDSAVQMLSALRQLNQRRIDRSLAPLHLGVGISTGEVVAGTIGSPKRMDYTVIGDSVNLSSRLQALTKTYGVEIIVCEATAAAVGGRHPLRELDLIIIRGRQRPAKVFQVLPGGYHDGFAAVAEIYQRGRDRLACRDWSGAIGAFEEALVIDPHDHPSRLMLERSRLLAAAPPRSDWDGVWQPLGYA